MEAHETQPDTHGFEPWPMLPYASWKETLETLHLWTQIVGKVRLTLSPYINHWWQVPLYVTPRGLTTSLIPYRGRAFEVSFDFIEHNLLILTSDGTSKILPLIPRSVAAFYREFMDSLQALNIEVTINTLPSEITDPIPCDEDEEHAAYDAEYANRFWRVLLQTTMVMQEYRSQFIGKSSPIHFFWGSFDLALTFFSGRPAPQKPGVDPLTREAYSHEVISVGFWPGNAQFPHPAFYSYTIPAPDGIATASIHPSNAYFNPDLGEFLLKYDDVRSMENPEQSLLDFFRSTYATGANLAHWDRATLERQMS